MIPLTQLVPYPATRAWPSPNRGTRNSAGLAGIVLHATADGGNEEGSLVWMANPDAQASAHLLVHRDGMVTRLVPDTARAWHAGASEWRGLSDLNSSTLGIEIANRNDGREAYTDAQYARVAEIVAHYLRQGLTLDDVVSHAEVARPVGRKTDPLGWDWERFRAGVGRLLGPTDAVIPPPAAHSPAPHPAANDRMILERIEVPRREHVDELLRLREIAGDAAREGLGIAEELLRGVIAGQPPGRREILEAAADALADWLRDRAA